MRAGQIRDVPVADHGFELARWAAFRIGIERDDSDTFALSDSGVDSLLLLKGFAVLPDAWSRHPQ
jgi:hypothetical protein